MPSRYTNVWDETSPKVTDIAGYMYQHMQNLKIDVRERMQYPAWCVRYKLVELGTVSAGTVNLNISSGDAFSCTLPTSGTVTFDVTNVPSNDYDEKITIFLTIIVKMPSSGTPSIAWSSKFKSIAGFTPSTTANSYTIYQAISVDISTPTFALMPIITGLV